MKKFIIVAVIFLAVVISLTALVRKIKLKEAIENEIENSLGIKVTIEQLELSPLLVHIGARGVTIHNPAGFPDDELAYIRSIHFVIDPLESITSKKPSVYLMALDLQRLNIVKNKGGEVNIKELIPIEEPDMSEKNKSSRPQSSPFCFDVFILSMDQLSYIDYSSGAKKVHDYQIGIKDQAFVGLKDSSDLVRLVVYKAIQNTDIAKLINLTVIPVISDVTGAMGKTWGTFKYDFQSMVNVAAFPFKLLLGKDNDPAR